MGRRRRGRDAARIDWRTGRPRGKLDRLLRFLVTGIFAWNPTGRDADRGPRDAWGRFR